MNGIEDGTSLQNPFQTVTFLIMVLGCGLWGGKRLVYLKCMCKTLIQKNALISQKGSSLPFIDAMGHAIIEERNTQLERQCPPPNKHRNPFNIESMQKLLAYCDIMKT